MTSPTRSPHAADAGACGGASAVVAASAAGVAERMVAPDFGDRLAVVAVRS